MAPSGKPEHRLNLAHLGTMYGSPAGAGQPRSGSSTGNTSPNLEPHSASAARSPFGNPASSAGGSGNNSNKPTAAAATAAAANAANARTGAGSPSHDLSGGGSSARPFSKRAREIQASEGLVPQFWGPPASGGSTPLRETIPESPSQDGFPDFLPPDSGVGRRPRAGTVPSRLTPAAPPGLGGSALAAPTAQSKSSRPTPSTSPFRTPPLVGADAGTPSPQSALLSRLRAGSMPQQYVSAESLNPFGAGVFSSSAWNNSGSSGGGTRNRSTTLASVRSADLPQSPSQSSFSKDGLADGDVKTLDYLGLAETPRQAHASLVHQPDLAGSVSSLQPYLNDIAGMNRNLSRLRSFSVNAKEKYAGDDDSQYMPSGEHSGQNSGAMTPIDAAMAQTRAQIYHHNLAVQAFASQATAKRPRARTAGVLDASLRPTPPLSSTVRFPTTSTTTTRPRQISKAIPIDWSEEYDGLPEAVHAMNLTQTTAIPRAAAPIDALGSSIGGDSGAGQDKPTRALWIGNVPTSTTASSLEAVFGAHGKIESCRVLVHKSCGFVNFYSVDAARLARAALNGKEIFPGNGAVRIGYAKEPTSSGTNSGGGFSAGNTGYNSAGGNTGYNNSTAGGYMQSGSDDPHSRGHSDRHASQVGDDFQAEQRRNSLGAGPSFENSAATAVPSLSEAKPDMLQMAHDFGATAEERYTVEDCIDSAAAFTAFQDDIPPVPEISTTPRDFDAIKLREVRKRIDNGGMSASELEDTARAMLPEIAELAADYIGNTVVQKLFEYCSDDVRDLMLAVIAPHLAKIGVHKNGTWAAQKIIDVAKTESQMQVIVEHLRPYTVALFLDQYGNYVLQGCLRFGAPYNNFIFETMLSRMWDVAQGRFGARAMRACLESHHASRSQQRMLAASVVLHAIQLSANPNSALLLTWLLDTCTLPNRRTALAPRLTPHLVSLCTHKVAYLTVLKVVNQRNELEARDIVLEALFLNDNSSTRTLQEILADAQCGATTIYKILTAPAVDEQPRANITEKIRTALIALKASPAQGYKRLMDEVGVSVKATGGSVGSGPKPDHHSAGMNGFGNSGHAEGGIPRPRSSPYLQHHATSGSSRSRPPPPPPASRQHYADLSPPTGYYTSPPTMQTGFSAGVGDASGYPYDPMSAAAAGYGGGMAYPPSSYGAYPPHPQMQGQGQGVRGYSPTPPHGHPAGVHLGGGGGGGGGYAASVPFPNLPPHSSPSPGPGSGLGVGLGVAPGPSPSPNSLAGGGHLNYIPGVGIQHHNGRRVR